MNTRWAVAALALIGWGSEWGPTVADGMQVFQMTPGLCSHACPDWDKTFYAYWRNGRVEVEAVWGDPVPLASLGLPPEAARALASTLFDASVSGARS